MEAPIPASALIHSATLVSAGIYICGRYSNLLSIYFSEFLVFPAITAFYGAIVASCQTDVKKILAYSTISHCGYLFYLVFLNNMPILIIYLYLHGFFKALSFTLIGLILTKTTIYQDFRKFGGSTEPMSFEGYTLPVILLNLGGLPFFLGFFSKFFFLEIVNVAGSYFFINLLFLLASICGFIYSMQIIYNLFYGSVKNLNFFQNFFFKKTPIIYYVAFIFFIFLIFTA